MTSSVQQRAVSGQRPGESGGPRNRVLALPVVFALALLGLSSLPFYQVQANLLRGLVGAALVLVGWTAVVFVRSRSEGRRLTLEVAIKKQHWVQACAQIALFLYWGWYVRTVYAFFPLIFAQLLFAFGIDALVAWSRRDSHRLSLGPIPIILSINLFLVFRPEWFHWQFVVIVVGYLGKELIRWQRDGRSAHIFNPSSFPLAVFSLVLLVAGATDTTLGFFISQSQFIPPHMYALVFLVSIPGQILFGVARMTLVAVLSMVAISLVYLELTGTYMFKDAFISLPVFLGMHLLFTDPSTSPRTELGQVMFGVLYALGITFFFFVLDGLGLPTFYEKLLPVPILNLMVRRIDIIARSDALRSLDPARIGRSLTPVYRNVAYTSAWVGAFALFSTVQIFGDNHPGQYYPFWRDACEAGSERACEYRAFMALNYCNRGSGWACNEFGILLSERRQRRTPEVMDAFHRACDMGFEPGCENANRALGGGGNWAWAQPRVEDLPVVLRGSKGPVSEDDPTVLRAMACDQGWRLCSGDMAAR